MPFDYAGATAAGATDDEIKQHLIATYGDKFDVEGALSAGATLEEISQHVGAQETPVAQPEPAPTPSVPEPPAKPTRSPDMINFVSDAAQNVATGLKNRFNRIGEPTQAAQALNLPEGSMAADYVGIPERLGREVGLVGGFAGDVLGGAMSIGKRELGRVTGGLTDKVIDPLAEGAGKLMSSGITAYENAFNMGDAEKANFESAVDAANLIGLRTPKPVTVVEKAGSSAKSAISQVSGIEAPLLEKTAGNRTYRRTLQKAGVDASQGAVESMVDELQQKLSSENARTRTRALEKIDQINTGLETAVNKNIADADAILERELTPASSGAATAGEKIYNEYSTAKDKVGERFGSNQNEYLNKEVADAPFLDAGKTVSEMIDKELELTGYDPKKGWTGDEKMGNVPLTESELKDVLNLTKTAMSANSLGGLINRLRLLRKDAGKPKADGSFYDSKIIARVDYAYQRAIEKYLGEYSIKNGGNADDMVSLWRANNAQYIEASNALKAVDRTLSVVKKTDAPETFPDKIKNIGTARLLKTKDLAARDELVAPVWRQMQEGFSDGLIFKSLDEAGNLSFDKLVKNWSSFKDHVVREIMLGKDKVQAVDNAIENYRSAVSLNSELAESAKNQTSVIDKLSRSSKLGKKYDESGNVIVDLNKPSALTKIKNIGNKTPANIEALSQLEVIDSFFGTNYAEQAVDFFNAKKLSVTDKGSIPTINAEKTGRSLLGGAIGGAIGGVFGAIIHGIAGAEHGAAIGAATTSAAALMGELLQSPGGAVAAYRAINTIVNNSGYAAPAVVAAANATKEKNVDENPAPSKEATVDKRTAYEKAAEFIREKKTTEENMKDHFKEFFSKVKGTVPRNKAYKDFERAFEDIGDENE